MTNVFSPEMRCLRYLRAECDTSSDPDSVGSEDAVDAALDQELLVTRGPVRLAHGPPSHARVWMRLPWAAAAGAPVALLVAACSRCGARDERVIPTPGPLAPTRRDTLEHFDGGAVRAFTDAHRWCVRPRGRLHQGWDLPDVSLRPDLADALDDLVIPAQKVACEGTKTASAAESGVTLTYLVVSASGTVAPYTEFVPSAQHVGGMGRRVRPDVQHAVRVAAARALRRGGALAAVVLTVLTRRASAERVADVIVATPESIQRRAFPDSRRAARRGWTALARAYGAVDGLLAISHAEPQDARAWDAFSQPRYVPRR